MKFKLSLQPLTEESLEDGVNVHEAHVQRFYPKIMTQKIINFHVSQGGFRMHEQIPIITIFWK